MKWSTATELFVLLSQEVPSGMTSAAETFLRLGTASLGILSASYAIALWTLGSKPEKVASTRRGISVLKPLKGVEAGLEENLAAVLGQDHPNFEVLFAAEDPSDPALEVARRVCAKFPHVPTRVMVGDVHEGLNPKVRLLRTLESHARHELILISDSNVRPGPTYLREIQDAQVSTGAGLVHCLLGPTHDVAALGDLLEHVQLTSWVVPTVSITSLFRHPVVIGKSMLLERSALHEVGGFDSVRDFLAEDHVLGRRFSSLGMKVALSPYLLPVTTSGRGFSGFWNRYLRWNQMQKTIAPFAFVATLLVQPIPYLALALAFGDGSDRAWATALIGLKVLMDSALLRIAGGRLSLRAYAAWALRELLFAPLWFVSVFTRKISWRGQRLNVGWGSRLTEVES